MVARGVSETEMLVAAATIYSPAVVPSRSPSYLGATTRIIALSRDRAGPEAVRRHFLSLSPFSFRLLSVIPPLYAQVPRLNSATQSRDGNKNGPGHTGIKLPGPTGSQRPPNSYANNKSSIREIYVRLGLRAISARASACCSRGPTMRTRL